MTKLKTVKELIEVWFDSYISPVDLMESVLTQDRAEISRVLCEALSKETKGNWNEEGEDYREGYNQALDQAKVIVTAVLSEGKKY